MNYLGCKVINLSNVSVSDEQIKVLEKGITFVPTPDKVDLGEIHYDVSRFLRRVKLKVHFHDDNMQISQDQNNLSYLNQVPKSLVKFKPLSRWEPPIQDCTLKAFCNNVRNDILN